MMPFIPVGIDWQVVADHFISDYFSLPYQDRLPVTLITPDRDHPAIDYLRDHGLTVIPFNPSTNAPHPDAESGTAPAR